jgi:CBS domain-containing protein
VKSAPIQNKKGGWQVKVEELMGRRVVSVSEKDLITHARQIMRDRGYQLLPVVNSRNFLKGVLTDKDAMRVTSTRSNVTVEGFISQTPLITAEDILESTLRAMAEARLRYLPVVKSREEPVLVGIIGLNHIFNALKGRLPEKKISEIMTCEVITCQRSDPLNRVWSTLLNSGISGMPVMDGEKPVGIITIYDIIKSGYARLDREARHTRTLKVEKVMNTPIYTVSKDESIRSAIEQLLRLNVGRLSVTDNGKLVGIVDLYDLAQSMVST